MARRGTPKKAAVRAMAPRLCALPIPSRRTSDSFFCAQSVASAAVAIRSGVLATTATMPPWWTLPAIFSSSAGSTQR